MSTSPDHAVVAAGLKKSYGDVRAVAGVDLTIPTGTVFALLGPNGAGKSTTIKLLSTLARPDAGSARVGGFDVVVESLAVRQVIGVVAQASGVDPVATARENLMLQGRIHGIPVRMLRRRVAELLARFGLEEAADRPVHGYSGGMVRRLDLAMGLVHRPTVLFLDEPTTGLDPEVRATLWEDVERLRLEDSLTIVLTTHYLEEADRLAGRVAIADRGRVVAEGTPEELKRSLSGDTLQLEVPTASQLTAVQKALVGVDGLHAIALEDTHLSARAADGARVIPHVLSALDLAGIPVSTATVSRPSLDDVYLAHTGRHLTSTTDLTIGVPPLAKATR